MEASHSEMTFDCAFSTPLTSDVRRGSNIESARYCHYTSRSASLHRDERRLHVLNAADVRKEDGCALMFEPSFRTREDP